jgi:hypothetical protein
MHYKAGESLGLPNSGAGAAMGMGMGAGMGMQMGGMMAGPWGQRPMVVEPVAPPPPPVEHVWHIAENGETTGPFSKADLGQMAEKGEVTRATWVWTPGQDGWMHAEETELAELFTVSPPPPPES